MPDLLEPQQIAPPRVFTPEQFGAGTTATDAVAVQAAISAAQTSFTDTGLTGEVLLSRMYDVTAAPPIITAPVSIRGVGRMLKAGLSPVSGLTTSSATATCLTIRASNVHLRNFAVVNTSSTTPTAGYGIFIDSSGSATWGDNCTIDGVDTMSFYTNVRLSAGSYWRYINNYNFDAALHGLHISNANNPDGGDQYVTNNAILGNRVATGAAIFWESGGGTKIVSNKINSGYEYGIWVQPAVSTTSVFLIESNSIENCRTNSIKMNSTLAFQLVNIIGNEIAHYGSNAGRGIIDIDGGTSQALAIVRISENILKSSSTRWAIWVDGVNNCHIGANTMSGTLVGGYYIGPNNIGVNYIPPTSGGTVVLVKDDHVLSDTANKNVGNGDYRLSRGIVATGKVTPVAHWNIGLRDGDSCVATYTIAGTVTGVGPFMVQATRALTRTGTGAITVATVGTDTTTGAAATDVVYAFDTATSVGEVRATLLVASGSSGSGLTGKFSLSVAGSPNVIKRGIVTTPSIV